MLVLQNLKRKHSFPLWHFQSVQLKVKGICDRLDIYLIGDITYGGKKHNEGNHICFKSADGRKPGNKGLCIATWNGGDAYD